MGYGMDLLGTPARQVDTFREVLAQKAARILIRAALPWTMRVSKKDLHPGFDGKSSVIR